MHVHDEFLTLLPTYRRNAWLFFRRYRDRDELIQNALGNAWMSAAGRASVPAFGSAVFRP